MAAYTIFQAHVMYVTFKIALHIRIDVSNKPCLYLFATGTGVCTSFNKVYLF